MGASVIGGEVKECGAKSSCSTSLQRRRFIIARDIYAFIKHSDVKCCVDTGECHCLTYAKELIAPGVLIFTCVDFNALLLLADEYIFLQRGDLLIIGKLLASIICLG